MDKLEIFLGNIVELIIGPIILLLFALALFFFANNVGMFLLKADDVKAREIGKRNLLWGIIGIFVMVSVYSILAVVTQTFCGTAFCR